MAPPWRPSGLFHPQRWLPWLGVVAAWIWLFGPTLLEHIRRTFESRVLCDDDRIVLFHVYHWADSTLFRHDLLGQYHTDGTAEGFRLLYYLVAKLSDPLWFSKALTYPLYFAALVGIAIASSRIGGRVAAFVTVALCSSSTLLLDRIGGGLPRAFGYPLLAWSLAALVYGRVRALCALTVIAAALYPAISVINGLTLAILLLVMPARDRGWARIWSRKTRALWLGATAAATILLVVPFALRMRAYGTPIHADMVAQYPEAGPSGRPNRRDRPPFPSFFDASATMAKATLFGRGEPLVSSIAKPLRRDPKRQDRDLIWLGWLALIGCARLGYRDARFRRLAAVGAAAVVSYLLADWASPSLIVPERYVHFAIPLLVALILPSAVLGWLPAKWLLPDPRRQRQKSTIILLVGVALLCLGGTHGNAFAGYYYRLPRREVPLLAALGRLPNTSVLAGWPTGVMDDVPLMTHRTAYLTHETHVPYHTLMTLTLRTRMRHLISAYFSTDLKPLISLRDREGVTHLVVDRTLIRGSHAPRYMSPFDGKIARAFDRMRHHASEVLRQEPRAAVYSDNRYFVLDLARLRP